VAFQYLLYDVFTDAALTGNQLAVFTDARDVPSAVMQRIARELNLSETTFVLPAERDDTNARMRIFTPAVELPMAGHPTIGSTFALARRGVIARGQRAFTFGLNVGPTPVELQWDGDDVRFVSMSQLRPSFGRVVDRSAVATALGLTENDFRPDLPIEEVSCGVPYLIVPLKDADAVARAVPDGAALRRLGEMTGAPLPLYLFAAGQPGPGGSGVFLGPGAQSVKAAARAEHVARMFAPGIGVLEDPATGSAAGPLGCYLVQHAQVSNEGARRIVIQQGASMNRPSVLHVSVDGDADAITSVKVGGGAVLIGRGELYL
jgi:trans-2,3-dihydro-3-hydroxyanthranilate isomerase